MNLKKHFNPNIKIGITGWSTGENSFGVTKPYLDFFSNFGVVEILTPQKGIRNDLNLVVLPGGADTYAKKYDLSPGFFNSNPDVVKEYFVDTNLDLYINNGTPVLGICLGLQQIAVKFGSKLTQHMYHPYSSPRSELVHKVLPPFTDENDQYHITTDNCLVVVQRGKKDLEVNSLHHQAVRWDDLGQDLEILLLDEDGEYVEALKHITLPIYGLQWHPEEIHDNYSINLIKKLLTK